VERLPPPVEANRDIIPRVRRPFAKYHGLGNDFLIVDGRDRQEIPSPDAVRRICDRRRGVGADGVLTLLPATGRGVAFMHVTNSDGSVAAMCGNGIRCAARYLQARGKLSGNEAILETDSGPRRCRIQGDEVSVEMGAARVDGERRFDAGGRSHSAILVSVGNPHAVIFGEADPELATRAGPAIAAAVPGGINAGFAAVKGTAIELVVWERGAGLTEACGTGACAAAAAAVKTGKLPASKPIAVRLPGGELTVTVSADLSAIEMRGPAVKIFEGEIEL
jgi:diaminopimelate epimerase